MRHYTQLTQEERYQIHALMKAGHSFSDIARILGRSKSTISREVRRNKGLRGYRPKQAHRLAQERRKANGSGRIPVETWRWVDRLLRGDWSPEQISLWLAEEKQLPVSHEWIYQYILRDKRAGGDLHTHLRCQKPRKKRYGTYDRRGRIPNQKSIEERPAIVEHRSRIGDWELDTIIGRNHSGVLVSLVERKSRLVLLAKVPNKTAQSVHQAILDLLGPLEDRVYTLTADNGKEFAHHEAIAQALSADFYFAHPYASWERGLNENTNGLVRQYFPKRRDFTTITETEVRMVMDKLNNRPRKCLGMKTPNQVFFGIKPPVALVS